MTVRQAESVRLMIDSTRLVNRLQDHIHGKEDGTTVDLSATQIQAAKILLDKSLPSLQSADITAHSSPQIEGEGALLAKLAELLRKNPQLIKDIQAIPEGHTLPGVGQIEHTTSEDASPPHLVSGGDVHTQQHESK